MLNFKSILRFTSGIAIAIFFLYLAFKGVNWVEFLNVFFNVNYFYVSLMLLAILFSHFFRALRWKYLLKPIKSDTSLLYFFEATMIGYFANNIFPRSGEILKAYTLSNDEKISTASSIASVFLERIIDMIFSLFFFGIAILWNKKIFDKHYPWLGQVALIVALMIGFFIVLISILLIWRDKFINLLSLPLKIFSHRLAQRFESAFNSFIFGFEALKYRSIYPQVTLLSFLIYLSYILAAYFPLFAFEIDRTKIGFFTALVIFVVSTIGFIIPTPGGVGSYHSFITGALVGLYGVKHEVALGYAVLTHGVGYLINGLLGLYFALKKHVKLMDGIAQKIALREK